MERDIKLPTVKLKNWNLSEYILWKQIKVVAQFFEGQAPAKIRYSWWQLPTPFLLPQLLNCVKKISSHFRTFLPLPDTITNLSLLKVQVLLVNNNKILHWHLQFFSCILCSKLVFFNFSWFEISTNVCMRNSDLKINWGPIHKKSIVEGKSNVVPFKLTASVFKYLHNMVLSRLFQRLQTVTCTGTI